VATLNLWAIHDAGSLQAWADRREVLRAGFRDLRPDLVAFQEAIRTDDHDQVLDVLGPGYHLAHQQQRERDGSGVSIASRWPLGEVHEVDQHHTARTADFPCTTLAAEVHAPDPIGQLLFVNHKPSYKLQLEHERELQAAAAARLVEGLVGDDGGHVVLAGDFDAGPDSASVRLWRGRQSLDGTSVCYHDAWETVHHDDPGHTFTPANPLVARGDWLRETGRRIDYVMVRAGRHGPTLRITACARLFDEPVDGIWASDHFGVTADLAVETRTSLFSS
jgi:endonuclease/exonuclease/phosphatase family metal-dependent hydrolase